MANSKPIPQSLGRIVQKASVSPWESCEQKANISLIYIISIIIPCFVLSRQEGSLCWLHGDLVCGDQ